MREKERGKRDTLPILPLLVNIVSKERERERGRERERQGGRERKRERK